MRHKSYQIIIWKYRHTPSFSPCHQHSTVTQYYSCTNNTQSLIAVIKQLNLEQQLLMWHVGVLAGSIIITRINPTHTHTCICKYCLRGMFTLSTCMCACTSMCSSMSSSVCVCMHTCEYRSTCMALINSLQISLNNISALTYFHIVSKLRAWPSVHTGAWHTMDGYIKACTVSAWVYTHAMYCRVYGTLYMKNMPYSWVRQTVGIYHK